MAKATPTHIPDHLRTVMFKLQLETVVDTKDVKSYYMRNPCSSNGRVLLTFTPEGIVIQGDLAPEPEGSLGRGCGLEWFLSMHGGEYLDGYMCGKFLTLQWIPQLAAKYLRRPNGEFRYKASPEQLEGLDELCKELEAGSLGYEDLRERLNALKFSGYWDVPGIGHDPQEAAVLCAIQQRFRELWPGPLPK